MMTVSPIGASEQPTCLDARLYRQDGPLSLTKKGGGTSALALVLPVLDGNIRDLLQDKSETVQLAVTESPE